MTTEVPDETPKLERWGMRMLQRAHLLTTPAGDGTIHVLDLAEQQALARIERSAVARATIAGALSALASAVTEIVAGHHFSLDHAPTAHELAGYWSTYGLVTLVASVAEIVYLYVDTLVAVRALAASAGLSLADATGSREIAAALARAALELPDPDRPVLGVNPRRESSRAKLVLASLAYKAKIGVSSFVLKMVIRRALGRLATRQLLAFAAVPVNAIWNGVVTYRVLREARVRAMGPSAVEALMPTLLPDETTRSVETRQAVARAVAASIVRTEAAHPNLVYLLRRVLETMGPFDGEFVLDDPALFLAHLTALSPEDRTLVRRVLTVASILDGKLAANERRLLRDAGVDTDAARALCLAFVRGQPLSLDAIH